MVNLPSAGKRFRRMYFNTYYLYLKLHPGPKRAVINGSSRDLVPDFQWGGVLCKRPHDFRMAFCICVCNAPCHTFLGTRQRPRQWSPQFHRKYHVGSSCLAMRFLPLTSTELRFMSTERAVRRRTRKACRYYRRTLTGGSWFCFSFEKIPTDAECV